MLSAVFQKLFDKGWQPIATAPKDRRIWVGVWCNNNWDREVCRWHPGREGWIYGATFSQVFYNPTHWHEAFTAEPPEDTQRLVLRRPFPKP